MKKFWLNAAFASFSLLAFHISGIHLDAQSSASAQLAGQILDSSGATVQDAAVQLVETERHIVHAAKSDSEGRYTLPNLEIGPYQLEVKKDGFKTYVQDRIILHVGDNRQVNVQMQIGEKTEQVNVVAGANLIQTEQNSVSQIISRKSILELPLNGRQPTQLVLISGASVVSPAGDNATSKNYWSSTTISVGGGQGTGTNYMLDGGDNTDTMTNVNLPFPFPDALQEFGVDTNALPARNGYQPGGLVTIVTKSGGDSLHGDLFEFVRNGDLNARNTFSAAQDTLKRNQFGGTVGGKIIKDKLFFFGGYQGTRVVSLPNSAVAYVPTAQELAGNFSVQESAVCQSSKTAHAPLNGQGFSNNQISPTKFDPAALNIIKLLPATTDPCGRISYGVRNIQDENQEIGRIDWIQSSKNTVFGRYFRTSYVNPAPFDASNFMVTQSAGVNQGVHNFTFGDSYTLTPSLLNSFHGTFTRRTDDRSGAADQVNAQKMGINIYQFVPNDFRMAVANDFGIGCGTCSPAHFNVNTYQFSNDLDWIKGAHHFGFGGGYTRTQTNVLVGYLQNGSFNFNGSVTGDAMADFLLGTMNTFQQSKPQQEALRESIMNLYAQDTVRLRSNLTLNVGIRWQPYFYPQDYFHRGSSFSLQNFLNGVHSSVYPTAPAGALYVGDAGVPKSFSKSNMANISPRLGLVWDPSGKGRESLRIGGGILYDSPGVYTTQRIQSNPPFVNEIDLTTSAPGGLSNPWTTGYKYPGGNPFPPTGVSFPQYGLWIVSPTTLKNTRMAQWNLSYQRQVGTDWVFSGSYMGNKTSHLLVGQELNPAINTPSVCAQFAGGCTNGNSNLRKRLELTNFAQGQYYGNVDQISDGANATYNALLVSANRRLTKGMSFLANYTWSHCISDADFAGDVSGPTFMNPANLRQDRGDCNFDVRHIFNMSVVNTTSFRGRRMLSQILGGWQIAPLVRATSGVPLNVLTGADNSRTGIMLDRPNLVYGVNPYASTGDPLQYLNKAAFSLNPIGTFGNLGRDALRGPGALNIDMAVTRIFAVRERYNLEVRGEAFNVINKVNYLAPASSTGVPGISSSGINLNANSASFGRITSAGDPRILQIAMKLSF